MSVRAFALATLLVPSTAAAFECTLSAPKTGVQPTTQVWRQRCIPYAVNSASPVLTENGRLDVVHRSFKRWTDQTCSDLEFRDVGLTDQKHEFDASNASLNRNAVSVLSAEAEIAALMAARKWSSRSMVAAAITSHSTTTGEIIDADILLNDVDFDFVVADEVANCVAGDITVQDLENTLVHEIGHVFGLDHVDDPEATMYRMAEGCETKKRDPAQDDVNGLCTVYPVGGPTATCQPPPNNDYEPAGTNPSAFRDQCARFDGTNGNGGCECSASHRTGGTSALAAVFLFALVATRRRRR